MTTRHCSVLNILAVSARLLPALALALAAGAAEPTVETLAGAYRDAPSPARRAALARYATQHAKDEKGALARLSLGLIAADEKAEGAAAKLAGSAKRFPALADYINYYRASALLRENDGASALEEIRAPAPRLRSPLETAARLLEAEALSANGNAAQAAALLRAQYNSLKQPDADMAIAAAYEKLGDLANAAIYYQKVWCAFPVHARGPEAAAALARLKQNLGDNYPPVLPQRLLERADKFLKARDYARAKREYEIVASLAAGSERDQARVRIGASDFLNNQTQRADRYLRNLETPSPEGDAERLYYLAECARRLGDDGDLKRWLARLADSAPASPWRLRALTAAGNRYLLQNQPEAYVPLYRSCYESFPSDPDAAYCHWKVTWSVYLQRGAEAASLLRAHLERYPASAKASAALYYLGRLAESRGEPGAAAAYYRKLTDVFPNHYYGGLALDRLKDRGLLRAAPSPASQEFLTRVQFRPAKSQDSFQLSPASRLRIERARLLTEAGFSDWAEDELRFGARNDEQPYALAMEVARLAESPFRALKYMKSLAPDYASLPLNAAPHRFWQLLFPLPWRQDLIANAEKRELDPWMLAGLIRQESEFNPKAVSRAKAYGLTQIVPATGRGLARQNGIKRFRTAMLFEPATNLKLGSTYIRTLLDQWNGKWEETLASYNAGKSRVNQWILWAEYREPSEFVETIPFTETRDYVTAVLRNASFYRRIYAEKQPDAGLERLSLSETRKKAKSKK